MFAEVATGPEPCAELAARLAEVLRSARSIDGPGVAILIDDGDLLLEGSGIPDLDWLAQKGTEYGVRIVAAVETQSAHRAFSGWLAQVLRERQGLLLDPDPAVDGTLVGGIRLPQRQGGLPPGRGYLVRRGAVEIVQVAGGP